MAPPLYFLPGLDRREFLSRGRTLPAVLERFRLDGVIERDAGATLATCEVPSAGPGGRSGLLLCHAPGTLQIGFYPDRQKWDPLDPDDPAAGAWMGFDHSQPPPGPADLVRARVFGGHPVPLADGEEYTIPVLRRPGDGRTSLPETIGWGPRGEFQRAVREEYRVLWEESARLQDLFLGGDPSYDLPWGLDLAIRILGLNYRYDRALHGRLHRIGSEHLEPIFHAAIDGPWVAEMLEAAKKNGPS